MPKYPPFDMQHLTPVMVAGMLGLGRGGSWSNGTDLSNSQSAHEKRRGLAAAFHRF